MYADWPSNELQYYWRNWALQTTAYDTHYHDKRDRMALEMAANGDPRARSALQRIISRDADPDKRQQAEALLATLDAAAVVS